MDLLVRGEFTLFDFMSYTDFSVSVHTCKNICVYLHV